MSLDTPLCPACGEPMVLRKASRGSYAGQNFFGCSNYPNCTEIVNLDDVSEDVREELGDSSQNLPVNTEELDKYTADTEYQIPVQVEVQSNDSSSQTTLLQNIAVPSEVLSILAEHRQDISQESLKALSQWRLDHPLPYKSPAGENRQVIAVVEKLLKRGTITIATPLLEDVAKELAGYDGEREIQFVEVFNSHWGINRKTFQPDNFESDEERIFYQNVIEPNAAAPWVVPQVSAASLAAGDINPASKQRVDFLLTHPVLDNCVIEVDGIQHEQQERADLLRDQALENNGYQVFRVPTNQVRNQTGDSYQEVLDFLGTFQEHKVKLAFSPHQQLIQTIKAGSQVQIAALEAVKTGFLDIDDGVVWNLDVVAPEGVEANHDWNLIVEAALEDLLEIFEDIYELQTGKKITIEFNLHSNSGVDIIIDLNPQKQMVEAAPVFSVSDIYLPFYIAQPLPSASPITIEKPDRKIAERFLFRLFRKETFLDGQWEGIQRTLQGKDSILLLPTGGGKSIAFQLAALLLPGTCLVIDPLIALIRDQIANLKEYGIDRVAGITSRLSREQRDHIQNAFGQSQYLFCYVSPERLQMQSFRSALRAVTVNTPISVIAIDEAHCVSEWGHDFRVSYLNIARNARNYCTKDGQVPPLLGLTGTASRSVLQDVRRELEITDFEAVITPESFDREELRFRVIHCRSDEKEDRLLGVLSSLPNQFNQSKNVFYQPRDERTNSGIIFFPHVNGKHGIYQGFQFLSKELGTEIGLYSGSNPRDIPKRQWNDLKEYYADQFRKNQIPILSCTKAFGMGIDKPNIRFTVHMNLPSSIEAYYQEAGRAGRDRSRSECVLIISNDYPNRNRKLLDPSTPLKEITRIIDDVSYAENDDITRSMYFHVNAFKGIDNEIEEVHKLINEIGDLSKEKEIRVPFSRDDRSTREKAVHRLAIIGAVSDYTVNYSSNELKLQLSGAGSEENLAAYKQYLANYDQNLAEQSEQEALNKIDLPHQEFVLHLVKRLIENFIYSIIEMSRRRSLSEMLQASQEGGSDKQFRARMLNYLELGEFTELLEEARQNPAGLGELLASIKQEIGSPKKAEELRGETSRLLEAYPNNPSLLLIRSLSEVYSKDTNSETVFENFIAFIMYATSSNGWGMKLDKVNPITSKFINLAGEIDPRIAQELVVLYLDEIGSNRETHLALVEFIDIQYSGFVVNLVIDRLTSQVAQLVS